MAIVGVQKIEIFCLQKKTREILTGLQELGCLEIINLQESGALPAETARRYQKSLSFLDEIFPRQRGFIENFIQVKPVLKKKAAEEYLRKNPEKILAALEKFAEQWRAQAAEIKRLSEEIERQGLYSKFGLARAKKSARLRETKVIFGSVPHSKLDAELMQVVAQDEQTAYVQIVLLRADEQRVRESLTEFQEIILPWQKQEYTRAAAEMAKNLAKLQKQQEVLKGKLAAIHAAEYARLAVWTEHLTNDSDLAHWAQGLSATEKTGLLSGWVPCAQKPKLQKFLQQHKGYLYWREVEPAENETPPIVLNNTGFSAPLESVTSLYGMPHAREFDPSPLMAPFFIVFYGLCLSDAGYGLMLFLFAAALLLKFRANLTKFGKKLLTLNIYCGISTMIVGLLTGSFFGMDFNILPSALRDFFLSLKIIDPMSNPLPLLGLSVLLGALQMLTGLVLRWILDIRQQGFAKAFLVSGCWFVFMLAIFGWVGLSFVPSAKIAAEICKYIVLIGTAFMILTQGQHQKSPLMKLGSGILSLYRLAGYVGDLLSYTRLFALGLVTAVMALVINYLAALTGGIPVVGFIIMVVILIFGHLLDFMINMLGSFVHSARLQYVEYFSKFFEGGGRFFRPFSVQTKYVSLE